MEIEFTKEARELLKAQCFVGDEEEALRYIGRVLVDRADNFGRTYAKIAGREIRLRVVIQSDRAIISKGRDDA